jgi:hypothetical protein
MTVDRVARHPRPFSRDGVQLRQQERDRLPVGAGTNEKLCVCRESGANDRADRRARNTVLFRNVSD